MSDIEQFRAETRAWLEDNCPASMRTPSVAEEMVWGGRRATFTNPDSKVWLERMGAKGWTAPMWPAQYGGGGLSMAENSVLESDFRRIKGRPAWPALACGCWGQCCCNLPAKARNSNTCQKSSVAKFAGARDTLSQAPALTLPACRPKPSATVTYMSLMARKSGPPMQTNVIGFSAWSAPTPRSNTTASALSCLICRAPASLLNPSS